MFGYSQTRQYATIRMRISAAQVYLRAVEFCAAQPPRSGRFFFPALSCIASHISSLHFCKFATRLPHELTEVKREFIVV